MSLQKLTAEEVKFLENQRKLYFSKSVVILEYLVIASVAVLAVSLIWDLKDGKPWREVMGSSDYYMFTILLLILCLSRASRDLTSKFIAIIDKLAK